MTGGDVAILILVGLVAGTTGGLLGVGGSIIMIPAMTLLLGPDEHLYQAAAMIVTFFVVSPAVTQHARARAIKGRTVLGLVPLAIVGVVAGVWISELKVFEGPGQAYLIGLFAAFLLTSCLLGLWRLCVERRAARRTEAAGPSHKAPGAENTQADADSADGQIRSSIGFLAAVALPTGLVSGLLGVGGGVVAVPLQQRVLRVPIRQAIANSAAIIIATSACGATLKNWAYISGPNGSTQSLLLALILAPTAIIGSLIGSRLTHALPVSAVKAAFLVLLSVAGVNMSIEAVRLMPAFGG